MLSFTYQVQISSSVHELKQGAPPPDKVKERSATAENVPDFKDKPEQHDVSSNRHSPGTIAWASYVPGYKLRYGAAP